MNLTAQERTVVLRSLQKIQSPNNSQTMSIDHRLVGPMLRNHMKKEFNSENAQFLDSLKELQLTSGSIADTDKNKQKLETIFSNFFKEGASSELNIPSEMKNNFLNAYKDLTISSDPKLRSISLAKAHKALLSVQGLILETIKNDIIPRFERNL